MKDNSRIEVCVDGYNYDIEVQQQIWLPTEMMLGQWDEHSFDWEWRNDCHIWEEINPAYLRDVFEKNEFRIKMARQMEGNAYSDLLPSRFEPGTPGSILHSQILASHLENELLTACERLNSQMFSLQQAITDRILTMEAEAEKRWLKDL